MFIILTACGENGVKKQIYTHLEQTVSLEKGFEEQQSEITKLEEEEKEIYNEIIELDMDDFEKIVELSDKAIDTIDKRSELINLEKESIDSSEQEFKNIEELIEDLEEEDVKNTAKEMFDVMLTRYEAYENIYKSYTKALELEKELYQMLKKEDIKQEELVSHITKINESYKTVLESNQEFNEQTIAYNDLKKEFYQIANIDIEYDENIETEN